MHSERSFKALPKWEPCFLFSCMTLLSGMKNRLSGALFLQTKSTLLQFSRNVELMRSFCTQSVTTSRGMRWLPSSLAVTNDSYTETLQVAASACNARAGCPEMLLSWIWDNSILWRRLGRHTVNGGSTTRVMFLDPCSSPHWTPSWGLIENWHSNTVRNSGDWLHE